MLKNSEIKVPDTLGHIAKEAGLTIPNLEQLGLGTIRPLEGVEAVQDHQRVCDQIGRSFCRQRYNDRTLGKSWA